MGIFNDFFTKEAPFFSGITRGLGGFGFGKAPDTGGSPPFVSGAQFQDAVSESDNSTAAISGTASWYGVCLQWSKYLFMAICLLQMQLPLLNFSQDQELLHL